MWNAPACSAAMPSATSAARQSTSRASSRAVRPRAARNVVVVGLVGLAEVRRVGVRNRALRAHPVQRRARVETAGKRDADLLADGKILQDVRHEGAPSSVRKIGYSSRVVLRRKRRVCEAANAMSQQTKLHRYEGRGGIVTYDAKRCIHAAECVRGVAGGVRPEGEAVDQSGRRRRRRAGGRRRALPERRAPRRAPGRRCRGDARRATRPRSRPAARRICAAISR